MKNDAAAVGAAQECRITFEERQPDGTWKTISVDVCSLPYTSHFILAVDALTHALAAGAVTPDELARLTAGWMGFDPADEYAELHIFDRLSLHYIINGGDPDALSNLSSAPPGATVN